MTSRRHEIQLTFALTEHVFFKKHINRTLQTSTDLPKNVIIQVTDATYAIIIRIIKQLLEFNSNVKYAGQMAPRFWEPLKNGFKNLEAT